MRKLLRSDTKNVFIDCSSKEVFNFTSNLENIPRWESSLCKKVKKEGGAYVCESPMKGNLKIRAVSNSSLGVIDRYLDMKHDEELMMPVRIIPNGSGTEVLSTVFQTSQMSDDDYEMHLNRMEDELLSLKHIMEDSM